MTIVTWSQSNWTPMGDFGPTLLSVQFEIWGKFCHSPDSWTVCAACVFLPQTDNVATVGVQCLNIPAVITLQDKREVGCDIDVTLPQFSRQKVNLSPIYICKMDIYLLPNTRYIHDEERRLNCFFFFKSFLIFKYKSNSIISPVW